MSGDVGLGRCEQTPEALELLRLLGVSGSLPRPIRGVVVVLG
jgi:hypothetical protein